jgi:hypothetical protein
MLVKSTCVAVAVAAATALVLAPSAPSAAASAKAQRGSHCATRAEYKRVHHGQTKARVAHILHSTGHREGKSSSGGYRDEIRSYKTCSAYSAITISFSGKPRHKELEDAKNAIWVS